MTRAAFFVVKVVVDRIAGISVERYVSTVPGPQSCPSLQPLGVNHIQFGGVALLSAAMRLGSPEPPASTRLAHLVVEDSMSV